MAEGAPAVADNPRGYPLEIFGNTQLDEKFKCNLCNYILRDPVQSFCGHRFCKSCVEFHVRNNTQVYCTRCKNEDQGDEDYSILSTDQMFTDITTKMEMSKLAVMCVNHGCEWQGTFKQFEEHFEKCQFKPVQCTECGQAVAMAAMEEHTTKQCPHRVINCKFCKIQIRASETEEHLKTCPKQPLRCEACGKKKILRERMQHHMVNECDSITCPAGCGQIEKSKLQDHIKANVPLHMTWMVQSIATTQSQVNQLQISSSAGLSDLGAKVQNHIQEIENRIAAIERQLVDVINHGLPQGQFVDLKNPQTEELHLTGISDRCQALEMKTGTFEGIASALHRELDKTIGGMEKFENLRRQNKETTDQNTQKLRTLERTLALKDIAIAELDLRVQSLESASYDGSFVWKVTEFSKKQQDALAGRSISLYSPFFYTSRRGFKMCARLYPNGDGMGKGSHLSLFFVVMRGHYDALQSWPFKQRVSFCLVNQNGAEHVLDSFRPDPQSSSFKRPTSDMNIASGCPLFIRLESLTNPSDGFIKDDTIFIKVTVDTNDLREPLTSTDERIKVSSLSV